MKKSILLSSLTLATILFFSISGASAQIDNTPVSPGITPSSPFYFFDIWGEKLEEFFTFDKVAKAKLQVKFAKERVAEINVLINQGEKTDEKAVNKAKSLLLGNVAKAAEIIKEQKTNGRDVAQLAKEIDDSFDQQEEFLAQSFLKARKELKDGRIKSKQQLLNQALQDGNSDQVLKLGKQIKALENIDKLLKVEKAKIKVDLRDKKKDIEKEMDKEDQDKDNQERIENDEQEEKDEQEFENEIETEDKENETENEDSTEENDADKKDTEDKNEESDTENKNKEDQGSEESDNSDKQKEQDKQQNQDNSSESESENANQNAAQDNGAGR